jgi:hypothetical protein
VQVSAKLCVVFQAELPENLKENTVGKQSTFRCNWLESVVSSTCELAGLACQVSLEKLNRIAILNMKFISMEEKP